MDGWMDELQLCLSRVSLGFYLYQVIFVFGNFLDPREGEKKEASATKDFLGGKNGVLLPHYEGFNFFEFSILRSYVYFVI
jgi:hypothetical protein